MFGLFTAARDGPKPERDNTDTPGRDNTARRGRVVLYCGLGLAAAAAIVFLYLLFVHRLCDEEGFCLRLQLRTQEKLQISKLRRTV